MPGAGHCVRSCDFDLHENKAVSGTRFNMNEDSF